ncbi:4780_t:CDS:2 [Ambispora gerdemannii]|uniref:4780_t:CDS:1 n=1 Tax=Ambispora gerdemannii TaxID=144530 RepID=A0A9N8V3E2_9GLOM|nr:4780_t:CDS:2 [Ambispora gerdemannii]
MKNLPVGANLRPDILTLILNANAANEETSKNENSIRMSDTDIRDTLAEIIVGSVSTSTDSSNYKKQHLFSVVCGFLIPTLEAKVISKILKTDTLKR